MSSNGNSNGSDWLDDQRIRVGFLPLLRQIYRQPRHLEQQPMMIVGARNVVPPADDGGLHLKSVGPGQPVRAVLLDDEDARAGDERIGQTAEGTDGVGVGQVLERPLEPNQIGAGAVQRTVSAAIFARTIPTGTGTGVATAATIARSGHPATSTATATATTAVRGVLYAIRQRQRLEPGARERASIGPLPAKIRPAPFAEMIVGLDKVDALVSLEQDRLGQPSHAGSGVDGKAHGEGLATPRLLAPRVSAIAGQIPVEEGQPLRAIGFAAAVADHGLVVGLAAVASAGPEGRVGRVPFRPVEVLRRLQLGVAAVEVALVVGALDRGGVYFSDGIAIGIGIVSGLVSLIVERRCSGRRRGRAGVGAPLTRLSCMAITVLLPVTLGLLRFGFAGLRQRRRHGYSFSLLAWSSELRRSVRSAAGRLVGCSVCARVFELYGRVVVWWRSVVA